MPTTLGIDYGTTYVGVAIAYDTYPVADELTTLSTSPELASQLCEIIAHHQVTTMVFGIPYHEDGQEAAMGKTIRSLAKTLKQKIPTLIIAFIDEYGSSAAAEHALVGEQRSKLCNRELKKRVNQRAAKIILEDYLRNP